MGRSDAGSGHHLDALRPLLEDEQRIDQGRMLGRQWTPQHPVSIALYDSIGRYNFNNILMHLGVPERGRGSFVTSRQCEVELLERTADLLSLGFDPLSGYCTSGGTEANLYALWCARRWAAARSTVGVRWVVPELAHYSIDKALDVLGVAQLSGHEVMRVPYGEDFVTPEVELIEATDSGLAAGRAVVVVLTAGTTEFGRLDPITEVASHIAATAPDEVFLHVDAAYGGFTYPFLPETADVLAAPEISTVTVDYHKTLGAPIGAAAVLVNGGLHEHTWTPAPYLHGEGGDYTLAGSRSGLTVVQTWAVLDAEAQRLVSSAVSSRDRARRLAAELRTIPGLTVPWEPEERSVVFAASWDRRPGSEAFATFLRSFGVTATLRSGAGSDRWYRVVFYDHTEEAVVGALVEGLRRHALARSSDADG